MEVFGMLWKLSKCGTETWSKQMVLENDGDRCACCSVPQTFNLMYYWFSFQFDVLSVKHNKVQ